MYREGDADPMGKTFVRIERYALITIVTAALTIVALVSLSALGLVAFLSVGDLTGWYRIEDHMCKLPQDDCRR